ncbi:Shikimate kinase [Nymphon striatum]|nr:Shikimate kinase [Nymphon striatum]
MKKGSFRLKIEIGKLTNSETRNPVAYKSSNKAWLRIACALAFSLPWQLKASCSAVARRVETASSLNILGNGELFFGAEITDVGSSLRIPSLYAETSSLVACINLVLQLSRRKVAASSKSRLYAAKRIALNKNGQTTLTTHKDNIELIRTELGSTTLTLVGLMGAGKSVIGRKVASKLSIPFVDADTEIEQAAKMPVADIFSSYGEPEFRRLEASVIKRLLENGPQVLATGGGAFMDEETRTNVSQSGISVWLSAELDILMERVSKKTTRPLLKNANPRGVMQDLMKVRYPCAR